MIENLEVVRQGDELGNHTIFRLRLPSGREVFGFGSPSVRTGDWALGPTWCYFVRTGPSFVVDCGWERLGGKNLLSMMEEAGVHREEAKTVLVSHGHEDHDGGLPEFAEATGARILAHPVYDTLIRFYPEQAPPGARPDFPAWCWHCQMPASFSEKYCVGYHRQRARLAIERIGLRTDETIVPGQDGQSDSGQAEGPGDTRGTALFDGVRVYHVPGHAPDAIAIVVGDEAILVGDTVLPEITPHPTKEAHYLGTGVLLKGLYPRADQLYGIKAYLRSLKLLLEIGKERPGMVVLPAHRLYHQDRWNPLSLEGRVEELLGHHLQRCGDVLRLLKPGPRTARELAEAYFEPGLLRGYGIYMAINEIVCHCELLETAGDLVSMEGDRYEASGSTRFESLIESLPPWSGRVG